MHDQVAVVEQHPPAVVGTLASKRPVSQLAEPDLDVVGERSYVTVGGSRTDHEDVGHNNEVRDVEKGNVVALLVDDGFGSGTRRGFCVGVGWDGASFFAGTPILGGRWPCFARFGVEMVFVHVVAHRPRDHEPDRQPVGDTAGQHRPGGLGLRGVVPLGVPVEGTLDSGAGHPGAWNHGEAPGLDEVGGRSGRRVRRG